MKLYQIEIVREVEESEGGKNRHIHGGEISFEFNDSFCQREDGTVTDQGYQALVSMLTTSISQIAKSAKNDGLSEGKIIGEAIKQLEFTVSNNSFNVPAPESFRKATASVNGG